MAKIPFFSLLMTAIILLAGCEKETEDAFISESDKLFIGYWKQKASTDSTIIFERQNELAKDAYALGILSDGTFLENKNAGFCGTPPITYAEYEGSWLELEEDTLLIETAYWGGNMSFYLIIKSLSRKTLEVTIEYIMLEVPQ